MSVMSSPVSGLLPHKFQEDLDFLRSLPAGQQPNWDQSPNLKPAVEEISAMPGLVTWDEISALREALAEASFGRVHVIQAGDCAEDPAECDLFHISRKVALLDILAGAMRMNGQKPVIRVGRIAGQFSKPRSRGVETVNGIELPVYRGHMVNSPVPDPALRMPDPRRMLSGYRAARSAHDILRSRSAAGVRPVEAPVWTSHEALLLDYELPMLRHHPQAGMYLASTHWPWVGDRTRQPDGAHVALMGMIANPVACKVGPSATPEELVAVCGGLDPRREPGKLTLIARMGAALVDERLPPLIEAVRAAGHRALWMCDPMHGNTVYRPDGRKTRLVSTLAAEVCGFQQVVTQSGGVAVGLHVETTPETVLECVGDENQLSDAESHSSLCDPRLNPEQANNLVLNWRHES